MPKKLIEVALPLDAINEESARRKRKAPGGWPTTLHKWWAQRPLAACRAVIFASLVDDPSSRTDLFPTEELQDRERERLFDIMRRMILWESSTDEKVLGEAKAEIRKSVGETMPVILDPFSGSGSIPLEAQRLGLRARGSDLNPVAVLITKPLIELPPNFADQTPVNPDWRKKPSAQQERLAGATGLAEDVRWCGKWLHEQAFKKLCHLYPQTTLPKQHGGKKAGVIAWLWARTVKCSNPGCGARMPLVKSFALSEAPTSASRPAPRSRSPRKGARVPCGSRLRPARGR
jgi:putative DNA methylase